MIRGWLALLLCAGCGGSASETPFPPEPPDVNLEVEDMGQRPMTATEAKALKAATSASAAPSAAPQEP